MNVEFGSLGRIWEREWLDVEDGYTSAHKFTHSKRTKHVLEVSWLEHINGCVNAYIYMNPLIWKDKAEATENNIYACSCVCK